MWLCNVPIGTNKFTRAQSRKRYEVTGIVRKNSFFPSVSCAR